MSKTHSRIPGAVSSRRSRSSSTARAARPARTGAEALTKVGAKRAAGAAKSAPAAKTARERTAAPGPAGRPRVSSVQKPSRKPSPAPTEAATTPAARVAPSLPPLPGGLGGTPLVAVVGRPNVGKSTLFNRLARERLAIVHDEPGVTRDRHYADTTAFGRKYTLVDTGGFDPESNDRMKSGIAAHVRAAVAEADVIVFVSDAQTELTSADRAAVKLLRETEKPVLFAANKADSTRSDADAMELYRLGASHVFPISALHGRGIGELEAAIVAAFPPELPPEPRDENAAAYVAVVGKPNAGKSSLMNRVLGEARMLVDDTPGTTRDAIDAFVERGGKRYVFIDTAGIRRKAKVTKAEDAVEALSVLSAVRSIERAQVTVLLCDAHEGVAEQDAKILGLAEERARALIIALNKTDLLDKAEVKRAVELARDKISFAPFAPVVTLSAKTGRGVSELFATIDQVKASFVKRIGTGELNRFFESVLTSHPPPTSGGKAPRLYYITQAETSPPTFVIIASSPEAVHFSYRRFVTNQLRKHFGFDGVPIRIFYKAKRRRERRGGPPAEKKYVSE